MTEIILQAFSLIITAAVVYILVPLIRKAGAAIVEQVEQRTKSEKLTETLRQSSDIVVQVVTAVTQTYVDDLKKRGEFDADAQKQAFEMAKEAALALISEEAQQLIASSCNSFSDWLVSAIEAAVAQHKGAGNT